MKGGYFRAVVYDGSVYRTECLPAGVTIDDAEVDPILPAEIWDAPAVCDSCDAERYYMRFVE